MQPGKARSWPMLWQLFYSFFTLSPMTFGGGYAMLPLIEREVAFKRRWLTDEEMAETIAVAGSAPGGIGVNAAAYVGYRLQGIPGVVAAVAGMMLPTFLIVLALGAFFVRFQDEPKVAAALQGIQSAIIAMILYAAVRMIKQSVLDKATFFLLLIGLGLPLLLGVSPILLILFGGVAGVALVKMKEKLGMVVRTEKQRKKEVQLHSLTSKPIRIESYFGEGI